MNRNNYGATQHIAVQIASIGAKQQAPQVVGLGSLRTAVGRRTGETWSLEEKGGMDIANIMRKRSKPNKHRHGNGKSVQKPDVC
ncbi:hypothetical protein Tco_0909937 [Tanacetum coccineum]|uniref:Uncharacterized protein n=1 Tax=Tanacetum coccineum TaxID=301880 RepID=A0ABQ5CTB3_9ASTR